MAGRRTVATVGVLMTIASAAAGQPQVEVFAGGTAVPAAAAGTIATDYSPPLLFDGDFESNGGQTLTLHQPRSFGLIGGINLFATRHAGVQFLVARTVADLDGRNDAYAFTLHYVSRPPPNNLPVPVTTGRVMDWPDTTGSMTEWDFAANAVVRAGTPSLVEATISGGVAFVRLSGNAEPLAYTTFQLGGHSVLFENDYRLAASLGAVRAVRFNVGGDVSVAISRGAALMVGVRYLSGPEIDVPVSVSAIVNEDEVISPQTIAEIEQRLAPLPMAARLAPWRLMAALKLSR